METGIVKPLMAAGEVRASCQGGDRGPVFYLSGGIPSLAERRLWPLDLVQPDPARMPTVQGKPVWILCDQVKP